MSDVYIIMGPSGCGKTSVATELAERTGWRMIEGDAHHPSENVDKQSRGIALTDDDRKAWLDNIIADLNGAPERPALLACSALTRYVQGRLRDETQQTCHWILLEVPKSVLADRLTARKDHFMPADLLESQLSALDPPQDAILISAHGALSDICDRILSQIAPSA